MIRILLAALLGLLAVSPASAQKTKAAIQTEITTLFPDNTTGQLTPAKLRTVTTDIVNSYVDWLTCTTGGGLVYWSAGAPTCLVAGTSGQYLKTTGTSTPPAWVDITPSAIGAVPTSRLVNTTAPLAGGGNLTADLTLSIAGAAGQVLVGSPAAFSATPTLGVAGSVVGSVTLANATSGGVTIQPTTGALGSAVATLPTGTYNVVGDSLTQALTGKTYNGLTVTSSVGTLTIPNNASAALILSGNFSTTLTATGATNSTLPAGTHTLSALDVAQTWSATQNFGTNATISGVAVSAGQFPGTTTNNNATAGNVAEYVSSDVPVGSAVALTTATNTNLTSISLTAGDWDVTLTPTFTGGATTTLSFTTASISLTTVTPDATLGRANNQFYNNATVFASVNPSQPIPSVRMSLSGTTTIFAVVRANFATSNCSAFGTLSARRAR